MINITYGPAPTSHYRIVQSPTDFLFASPLDPPPVARAEPRRKLRSLARFAIVAGALLALAGGAFAVRIAVYLAGREAGWF